MCKLMLLLFSLGLCQYVHLQVPNHQSNIIKRPLGMFVYELEEVCTSVVVYQHFSLCLYFIEWILTQGLTPTNQNSLNQASLHSPQSILTSFLPSYLLFTREWQLCQLPGCLVSSHPSLFPMRKAARYVLAPLQFACMLSEHYGPCLNMYLFINMINKLFYSD